MKLVGLLGVWVFTFLAHLGQARLARGEVPADHVALVRQRDVIRLLTKVHEPNRFKDQVELVKDFDPSIEDKFKDCAPGRRLVKLLMDGSLLPRGQVFSIFDEGHREQMILLFETLLFAQDYETFFKTAVWARDLVNEAQFVHALYVAVLHREDTRGIMLPPLYEVSPHMFVSSKVIRGAYRAQMSRTPPTVIHADPTDQQAENQQAAYLSEDIGLNSHFAHWHMDFPFWWHTEKYGQRQDRKGELFYHMHHQMIARFDLERLCNNLPFVEPLSLEGVVEHGYHPEMTYRFNGEFPSRPDNFEMKDLNNFKAKDILDSIRRIKDSILKQSVITKNGEHVSLNNSLGIDIISNILQSTLDSTHRDFYGSLQNSAYILLGRITDPSGKYKIPPGVMEHFETMARDPAFHRLHKLIDNLFLLHKNLLPPYNTTELKFPGVKVLSMEFSELVTFFEDFEIDLSNAIDSSVDGDETNVTCRMRRLNHKPYNFALQVESEREATAIVRVFLGPKHDRFGRAFKIDDVRPYLVEIDKFAAKVNVGNTTIHRKSSESSVTLPDRESWRTMLKRVEHALQDRTPMAINKDERHCGYPDRLLLPRGREGGMDFQVYAILTDFELDKVNDLPFNYDYGGSVSYCGVVGGHKYPSSRPMGFPFDRRILSDRFLTPNMFCRDVTVTFQNN